VRTTIHRLRTFLEPRGEWVTVTTHGYGLAAPVHVHGAADHGEPLEAPLAGEEPLDEPRGARGEAALAEARVHDRLIRAGEASVPDLARALSLSESTVLRALRRLLGAKKVARSGAARATRYQARAR